MKIISLAPTQTEILAALGLRENLVGVTEDCDYPPWVTQRPRYGSWFAPDLNRVMEERPDLVCTFGTYQLEAAQVLRQAGLTVYHGDPGSVAAAFASFAEIARLTGRPNEVRQLLADLNRRLDAVRDQVESVPPEKRPRAFRIMNWDPLITVGPGAFQHDVIETAGGINIAGDGEEPYFVCDSEEIVARDPELIFFCEPQIRSLLASDDRWAKTAAARNGRIHVFDCGLTCRSGPRIIDMIEALARALYPET